MSINRVAISGNLTREPELRATQSGTEVLRFGVAVNDRRKNPGTGEWEDYPNFVDCTMFGKRAGSVSKYLSKGTKVSLEGKLHWSQWERDGQKRSKLEVFVDELEFMTSHKDGQGHGTQPAYGQQAYPAPPQPAYVGQQAGYQPQAGYAPQQMQAFSPQQAQQPAPAMVGTSVYDDDIPF